MEFFCDKCKKADREHPQKTFVTLNGLWLLRGWGSCRETVKKQKIVTKLFFQIMLNEVLKSHKK